MKTVKELLDQKGSEIISIEPNASLKNAIDLLVENGIGSVLVIEKEIPVGILTERDVLKLVHRNDGKVADIPVSEVMTKGIICGVPEDDLDYVMDIMTKNRFRHLPVVSEKKLIGILSIGDVVKALKSAKEYENHLLNDYISSNYPA